MMSRIAEQLVANEARLTAAWGDSIPPLSEEMLAAADSAAAQAIRAIAPNGSSISPLPGWTQGFSPALLSNLAAAYRDSRDDKYAQAARDIYTHWLDKEPVEKGWRPPPNYNILIIPHRLGDTECVGWFGALPAFLSGKLFDESFLARLIESASVQLNHLAATLHEGRNIRMTQCDALLTQGLRLSFIPDSAKWRDVGLRGLNDMFHRQFHPDGSSIEATGWYHYICMNMALRFLRLKRAMPELGLQATRELVAAAFDYTVALVQPDGEFTRIGDCTAAVYPHKTLQSVLDARRAFRKEFGLPESPPPACQYFPDAKQAMLRDGWGTEATYITFDATRCQGYHWHPARNAIQLQFRGSRVVADPGRMSYEPTPHRCYASSTRSHSTMNLNGWNQWTAETSFRYRSVEDYEIVDALYDGGYWPFDGKHGHGRGIFAEHHRILLWLRGRFIVVIDHLYNTAEEGYKPTVESNWQFAPGAVALDAENNRVTTQHGKARMLMLFPLKPEGMVMTLHEGEMDPCRGWVADERDTPAPAPLLRLAVEKHDPWNIDMATVLIPYDEADAPRVTVRQAVDPSNGKHGKIVLGWDDGSTDEFWWTRRMQFALEEIDGMRADSGLIHVRKTPSGDLAQAMVYDGSYLEPYTSRPLDAPRAFVIAGREEKRKW